MHCLQSVTRIALLAGKSSISPTTRTIPRPLNLNPSRHCLYQPSHVRLLHQSSSSAFRATTTSLKKDPKTPADTKAQHERDTTHIPVSITEIYHGVNADAKTEAAEEEMKKLAVTPTFGGLASSSILSDEVPPDAETEYEEIDNKYKALTRRERLESAGLYPNEAQFMRSQRLRLIRKRGRLTKAQAIAQTEKVHRLQSNYMKTSLKKLAPIARQISGKNLEHAMKQMRFSLKKVAREVLKHLEHAKAEAVVTKGFDFSKTYISQAWVGRGVPDLDILPRARGRADRLVCPYTCITVELKEEQTKERIQKDKDERLARAKPWIALPSKPIYGQQQYYTW